MMNDHNNQFVSYFSARADKVLEDAQNLVKSLDEAQDAQTKATAAIGQANEDIALAKADLEKVHSCSKHAIFNPFI